MGVGHDRRPGDMEGAARIGIVAGPRVPMQATAGHGNDRHLLQATPPVGHYACAASLDIQSDGGWSGVARLGRVRRSRSRLVDGIVGLAMGAANREALAGDHHKFLAAGDTGLHPGSPTCSGRGASGSRAGPARRRGPRGLLGPVPAGRNGGAARTPRADAGSRMMRGVRSDLQARARSMQTSCDRCQRSTARPAGACASRSAAMSSSLARAPWVRPV